ncbi:MAG TPA: M23 family metallopeptidase [Vulgatibacter sp.]|nr:M23 family metallopeptidase [Vulgatibacter sp.]
MKRAAPPSNRRREASADPIPAAPAPGPFRARPLGGAAGPRRRSVLARALLAALPAVTISLPVDAAADDEARLLEARAAIERILRDESDVAEELERAEAEVRRARAAADAAAAASKAAEEELALRVERERVAEEERVRTWELLRARLRARQRVQREGTGSGGILADSPAAVARRARALDRILERDVSAIRTAMAAADEATLARRAREEASARAAAVAEEARGRLEVAEQIVREREALLARLRGERRLFERTALAIERAQARLAEEMERLAAERARSSSGFAALRGSLESPVEGAVVEVLFGKTVDARFHTVVHQNGIDLRAPKGAPVRAVAAGRVAFAAPFRAYGNLVILDHGDGFHTLYGHLDSFAVAEGEEVAAGRTIGAVGDSGSLKGAYLYFEIREGAKPVDPLPWLRSR